MSLISASVGEGGFNLPADVKAVQRLLNQHNIPPLRSLVVDGIAGQATITAIRHFQSTHIGMKSPDGRVDPGGQTLRKLRDVSPRNTPRNSKPPAETPATRRADQKDRQQFVRPQVRELSITTKIIDAIRPHFQDVRAVVVSGYLNDSDLFWKVNYHWEYLLWMTDHAMTLGVTEKDKKSLMAIRSALLSCKPDPDVGYRTSPTLGKPEDNSTPEQADHRYKVLRQSKQDFKKIVEAANLKQKSPRGAQPFDLAAAPVAHPGSSKHSTGYAIDIQGDNVRIKAICKNLGATMTFDEKSHVHVEFKNGVQSSY